MGAWGVGAFENDDASDWALDLAESDSLSNLASAFCETTAVDYLEAPESCIALAAAEVVAALRGKPVAGLPSEVANWVVSKRTRLTPELVEAALQSLQRVRADSELKELWEETEAYASWVSTLDDLQHRLG